MSRTARIPPWALLAVFTVLVAAVYLASPVLGSGDGRLVVYESQSILHQGNNELSEFGPIVDGFPCYVVDGRRISRYPWGTSVVAAPLMLAAQLGGKIVGDDGTTTARLAAHSPRQLEKDLASILAALACLAMVLLVREATGRIAPALLLGVLYAFGTAMWSTVSRGLWQHGPYILLATIGLFLLVRARNRDDWRWAAASGLAFGAAFAVRPTASIPIALVGVLLLLTQRRALPWYVGAVAVVVLPALAINHHLYGSFLNPFYFHNGEGFIGSGPRETLPEGLAGTLVSPARGLLIYSPFLILAVAGLFWKRRRPRPLELTCAAVVLAIWVTVSNTNDWPGGWSYGPRLLCDTLPFLAVLLCPVVDAVTRPRAEWTRVTTIVAMVLVAGFAWGAFVNGRGAVSWSTQAWNPLPVGADWKTTSYRFWDWGDPPFLRFDDTTLKTIYPWDTPAAGLSHPVCTG